MSSKLIAANWKMNGSLKENVSLIEAVKIAASNSENEVLIIPPTIYIDQVHCLIKECDVKLGAQNISSQIKGAFTGETSVSMIKEFGCHYSLVGHSERRAMYGETDQLVAEKTKILIDNNIVPIICIGETKSERESGEWRNAINRQLRPILSVIGEKKLDKIVFAYEPVWAIGTGLSANAQSANEVHEYICCTISEKNDNIANALEILYGGSVNGDNVSDYLAQPYINGVLVGGASLDKDIFAKIIASK